MLTFHIVEVAAELFSDDLLANFASDLFEILGCYFPIHFTHVSVILYQPYSILSFDRIVFDFGIGICYFKQFKYHKERVLFG